MACRARRSSADLTPAQQGGKLHRRFGVYLDVVGVVTPPEDYESRMVEIFGGVYKRLRLWALDPLDVALCKLGRNSARDREDVRWLARQPGFDPAELRRRYNQELRPFMVGRPETHDLTLKLWLEMIEEAPRR